MPDADVVKTVAGAVAVLLAMGLVAYIAMDSEDRRRDGEKDECYETEYVGQKASLVGPVGRIEVLKAEMVADILSRHGP